MMNTPIELIDIIENAQKEIIDNANKGQFKVEYYTKRDNAVKQLATLLKLNQNVIPFDDRFAFAKWWEQFKKEIEVPLTNDYLRIMAENPKNYQELITEKRTLSWDKVKQTLAYVNSSVLKKLFYSSPDQSIEAVLKMINLNQLKKMMDDSSFSEKSDEEKLNHLAKMALQVFEKESNQQNKKEYKKILNRFFQQHYLKFSIEHDKEKNQFVIFDYHRPVSYAKLNKRELKKKIASFVRVISIPSALIFGLIMGFNFVGLKILPLLLSGPLLPIGIVVATLAVVLIKHHLTQKNMDGIVRDHIFKGILHVFDGMSKAQKIAMTLLSLAAIAAGVFFLFTSYGSIVSVLGVLGLAAAVSNPIGALVFMTIAAMAALIFTMEVIIDISKLIKQLDPKLLKELAQQFLHQFNGWSEWSNTQRFKKVIEITLKALVRIVILAAAVALAVNSIIFKQNDYLSSFMKFSEATAMFENLLTSFASELTTHLSFIANAVSNVVLNQDVWEIITKIAKSIKSFFVEKIFSKPTVEINKKSLEVGQGLNKPEIKIEITHKEKPIAVVPEGIIAKNQLAFFVKTEATEKSITGDSEKSTDLDLHLNHYGPEKLTYISS